MDLDKVPYLPTKTQAPRANIQNAIDGRWFTTWSRYVSYEKGVVSLGKDDDEGYPIYYPPSLSFPVTR